MLVLMLSTSLTRENSCRGKNLKAVLAPLHSRNGASRESQDRVSTFHRGVSANSYAWLKRRSSCSGSASTPMLGFARSSIRENEMDKALSGVRVIDITESIDPPRDGDLRAGSIGGQRDRRAFTYVERLIEVVPCSPR